MIFSPTRSAIGKCINKMHLFLKNTNAISWLLTQLFNRIIKYSQRPTSLIACRIIEYFNSGYTDNSGSTRTPPNPCAYVIYCNCL